MGRKQLNRAGEFSHSYIINKEGGIVYKEDDQMLLFLLMSNLKLNDSFYESADERLALFESTLDKVSDLAYKLALARFMSNTVGIKLAPVLAITREALRLKGLNDVYATEKFQRVVKDVVDRPDKITNAMAYAELVAGSAKYLPPFYKKLLRERLESFNEYTLRKFRLERRHVKLADAIKLLHPKPDSDRMSRFYKAVIENTKEASIEKGSVVTEVLSDTSLTESQKDAWIADNVARIPINALLRNLSSVPDNPEVHSIIVRRLEEVLKLENGLPVIKIVNPFDIIKAAIHCNNQKLRADINVVLDKYARQIDLGVEGKKVAILVDVSGSMGGYAESGYTVASLYLSLLFPALADRNTVSFYTFDTSVYKKNANAYRLMQPLSVYYSCQTDLQPRGGTSLVSSAKYVVSKENPDILIVISDEVTWADTDSTLNWKFDNNAHPYVIMINPFPSGGTVFSKTNKVVKVSSLDAKLLYYIPALYNYSHFKKQILS
jgi:hypothetical protein